jgi:hypothetical protein
MIGFHESSIPNERRCRAIDKRMIVFHTRRLVGARKTFFVLCIFTLPCLLTYLINCGGSLDTSAIANASSSKFDKHPGTFTLLSIIGLSFQIPASEGLRANLR